MITILSSASGVGVLLNSLVIHKFRAIYISLTSKTEVIQQAVDQIGNQISSQNQPAIQAEDKRLPIKK